MANYTHKGSEELDARICSDLQQIEAAVSPLCEAGILLGGYGRGEGTPLILQDGTQAPFNDYDVVVITGTITPFLKKKMRELELKLTQQVGLPVDLCPYARNKLSSREFSLLNYEMKYGHTVLWGDKKILNMMPDYPHEAIPLTEGTRLLLNRGKLLLELQNRLKSPAPLSEEEHVKYLKFLIKALLAMGDSMLLLTGSYAISYAVKKEKIKKVGTFPASGFIISGYCTAIEMKEWGAYYAWKDFNIAEEFSTVLDVYLRYMPWYRARCAAREGKPLRNLVQNLQWNHSFSTKHPREGLYDAIIALLQGDDSGMSHKRFYQRWQRFS